VVDGGSPSLEHDRFFVEGKCRRREERPSFLKKRSKRLLFLVLRQDPGHGLDRGNGGEIKVFWFFSSEKNTFLPLFFRSDVTMKIEVNGRRYGCEPAEQARNVGAFGPGHRQALRPFGLAARARRRQPAEHPYGGEQHRHEQQAGRANGLRARARVVFGVALMEGIGETDPGAA
jgi:hypothetical protein